MRFLVFAQFLIFNGDFVCCTIFPLSEEPQPKLTLKEKKVDLLQMS